MYYRRRRSNRSHRDTQKNYTTNCKYPTGNLDSKNSREIMQLLRYSNEKYHQTMLVITHDENIALQADRILELEDGKIVRDEVIRR